MRDLNTFPRIHFGIFPTPIHKLNNISRLLGTNVWIKRDDLIGVALGGNKVRKLEFLLADAKKQGAEIVFTTGGAQSNHAMLTAACANRIGLEPILILKKRGVTECKGNQLLEKLRLSAFTYDWLQEFLYPVWNPETGEKSIAWDLSPAYFSKEPGFYSPTGWLDTPLIRSNPDIGPAYREICEGLDGILKSHGYVREGMMYRALPETAGDEDEAIVFFCHFGITCFMMAHLTGISPILLLHHTIIPPSGVTVMNAEKDDDGAAHFRAQGIGDVSHLQRAGEPISKSGAFTPLFQE